MTQGKFKSSPLNLDEQDFVCRFGGVYEHSPWIAIMLYRQGLDQSHDDPSKLANDMAKIVDHSDRQQRLDLIVAHPDLAGKAAQIGELTKESTSEQSGAGIDQCNAEEFERFGNLNSAYKAKFKFPFVMAVKGSNRHLILSAFEERIKNDYDTEFNKAISEIHKIARLRLDELASDL